MKLSIVIPTLNEEKLLPRLLESIQEQTLQDYEIIIADAHSTDRTREIASSFGAKIVDGGKPGAGRNAGASAATGDFLFFFDADVVLPSDFLENAYEEMQERYIDLATCEIRPISEYNLDRLIHQFTNITCRMSLRIDPHAWGFCIFVTRRLFNRASGFDETITFGEDSEFVKRAAKLRNLNFLESVYIFVSVRRFEKEGRLTYTKKVAKYNLYRAFIGEIRGDTFEYEFGNFDTTDSEEKQTLLHKLEIALLKLETNVKKTAAARKLRKPTTPRPKPEQEQLLEEVKKVFKQIFKKKAE